MILSSSPASFLGLDEFGEDGRPGGLNLDAYRDLNRLVWLISFGVIDVST